MITPSVLLAISAAEIIQPLIIVFVVSTVTAGLAFSIWTIMFPVQTAADRLESLTQAAEVEIRTDITIDGRDQQWWEQIATRLGQIAQGSGTQDPSEDPNEDIRRALRHAGYKNRRALDMFNGIRLIAVLGVPVLLSPLMLLMAVQAALAAMLIGAGLGYLMPKLMLESQATGRQAELLRAFPDALDLLVSCVESGLNLDTSFRRVATEMRTVAPSLAREFTLVNSEISAGVERIVALKHLAERTGLEEVRSLVNMLAQSERYGSSIADSMRIYSAVAREKRMSRAEELAGQVGSKLTIVMILFFLPVLMVVLMAPSVIRMISD